MNQTLIFPDPPKICDPIKTGFTNQGQIAELAVQIDLLKLGLSANRIENKPYDILVEGNGIVLRVQVKSTSYFKQDHRAYQFKTSRTGDMEYTSLDADLFALKVVDNPHIYYYRLQDRNTPNLYLSAKFFTPEASASSKKQLFKDLL